jgi:uncharacterized protein (TIGR02646 family)
VIRLQRGEEPQDFSNKAQPARESAEAFYSGDSRVRRQRTHDWDSRVLKIARDPLVSMSAGKCSYCETPLVDNVDANVTHFRPTNGTIGVEGDYSPDHYWWLAYDWHNLLIACGDCDRMKGRKFPVEGNRCSIGAPWLELLRESPLLIDPTVDDPAVDLIPDLDTGQLVAITLRGAATIELLALNREYLVDRRRQHIVTVMSMIQRARAAAAGSYDFPDELDRAFFDSIRRGTIAYAAFARAALDRETLHNLHLVEGPAVRARLDSEERRSGHSGSESFKATLRVRASRYIETIRIENFRGLESLFVEMRSSTGGGVAPWTVLIGENGVGKSSVLQAVALVLRMAARKPAGMLPASVLRRGATAGVVELRLSGENLPLRVTFDTRSIRFEGPRPIVRLAGYGATRIAPHTHKLRLPSKYVHTANLFNPHYQLLAPIPWLMTLSPSGFDYAARVLKRVLLFNDDDTFIKLRDDVYVMMHGAELRFRDLSDGYRSMAALVADIVAFLQSDDERGLDSEEAIVLLDEIGANLHPRWKMRVVAMIREALPQVQFIATTHDPLCLRGVGSDEVQVLRRIGGKVIRVEELPSVESLRVDQLLTSAFFGLSSTIDPAVEDDFSEYYELLALQTRTAAESARVTELRRRLEPQIFLGATNRENLVLRYVDEFLARSEREPDVNARRILREETEREIRDSLRASLGVRDS